MKAVILAGGFGTRISEESTVRPKPMVEIGTKPILWHIMKGYSAHGVEDFIICCGHKGEVIKDWFAAYALHKSDLTLNLKDGTSTVHSNAVEPWNVTLLNTGESTMTGGRIRRARPYTGEQTFCATYGDGVGDVDIAELIRFHRSHGKLATMTAVQPEGRFGVFTLGSQETMVTTFKEKPRGDGAWVNAGFFVLEPGIYDFIEGDATVWEQYPLQALAEAGELVAYRHEGFWQPMDTLRDKHVLQELWQSGKAPWKNW